MGKNGLKWKSICLSKALMEVVDEEEADIFGSLPSVIEASLKVHQRVMNDPGQCLLLLNGCFDIF